MKTLTVSEAASNLDAILKQVIAGEEIGIRSHNTIIALLPFPSADSKIETEPLLPREALRRLQQDAHLTEAQAEDYLNEVRAERLTTEDRGRT